MVHNKQQNAFTLIELSTVLVVIGLVVGGIMTGKALIQQAEIRAATSQLQQLEAGYHAFRTKYNCIMGDCANATEIFGNNFIVVNAGCPPSGGAGNGNGNGDGFIDAGGYGGNWFCETTQGLYSLSLAKLLPTKIISPCRAGNTIYFKAINDSCGYFFKDDLYSASTPIKTNGVTMATFVTGGAVNGAALSPVQARLIDEKIDNGTPLTGKFRGLRAALPSGGAMVANSCDTGGVYNLNEDYTCRLVYYFK
jgi:prepilin-type N-terminal cleavage/methylation domain-containing protein